jgi:hypothetical protein
MKNLISQAKKRQAKRLKQAKRGKAATKAARLLAQKAEERNAVLGLLGIDPSVCDTSPVYADGVKIATKVTAKNGYSLWD